MALCRPRPLSPARKWAHHGLSNHRSVASPADRKYTCPRHVRVPQRARSLRYAVLFLITRPRSPARCRAQTEQPGEISPPSAANPDVRGAGFRRQRHVPCVTKARTPSIATNEARPTEFTQGSASSFTRYAAQCFVALTVTRHPSFERAHGSPSSLVPNRPKSNTVSSPAIHFDRDRTLMLAEGPSRRPDSGRWPRHNRRS